MTANEIIKLVKEVTAVDVLQIRRNIELEVFARYIAILIMHEEGIRASQIAKHLALRRETPYTSLKRAGELLEDNKQFKKMYLACIARIASMEE